MFYFRLAERLGKGVDEMLSTMSSHELSGWIALAKIDYEASRDRELRQTAVNKLNARTARKGR